MHTAYRLDSVGFVYYNGDMKLKNNFSDETRLLFLYVYWCFDCKRSDQGLELHHITGRDNNEPTNAFPICTVCHSKVKHNDEEHKKYKEITRQFLIRNGYNTQR